MKNIWICLCFIYSAFCLAVSDQGCGLGDLALKKKSMVSATSRYTVNGIFSSQWFGTTTGTSGCKKHTIVKNEYKSLHFIEANQHQLMAELSQGSGNYVIGLGIAMGCLGRGLEVFGPETQKNYGRIYRKDGQTPVETLNNVRKVIRKSRVLLTHCQSKV